MKVAVIGSGGREHALAFQMNKSTKLTQLYILPGNPGTAQIGMNIDINVGEHDEIVEFALEKELDLVVVGPEVPLVDGLADKLRSKGIAVFGPNKNAAVLEGSKKFSKEFMERHQIPTAAYKVFKSEEMQNVLTYLETATYPIVVKASGLAAGKGVAICEDHKSATESIEEYFIEGKFGESGREIVVEQFLKGDEASIFVITDGEDYAILPASQDHKRVFNNDEGPNTGGMGAYAPAPIVTDDVMREVEKRIIIPTLEGLVDENRRYNGCLYVGLMIYNGEPSVVEFNCRFGDPETQAVLPVLEGDLLQLLHSSAVGKIDKSAVSYSGKHAVCVVEAADGYPNSYQKGMEIEGWDADFDENVVVFHAGTTESGGKIVSNGGRVLGITSISSESLKQAKINAYEVIGKVKFEGMHFRTDISDKAFK